ncbi:hypothetical protein [Bacillus thuringiensis]|uniref:hypothetical protein n=1 Tax=Bacillus thuringiensis TaxID=1428 RepID=UPI000B0A42D7|nr:hypothetical protein [Bacillus thuringiensis]
MKTFVKPSMVNCGKSESVIKGDIHAGWLPGYKEVFKCAVVDGCSSDSNQC